MIRADALGIGHDDANHKQVSHDLQATPSYQHKAYHKQQKMSRGRLGKSGADVHFLTISDRDDIIVS